MSGVSIVSLYCLSVCPRPRVSEGLYCDVIMGGRIMLPVARLGGVWKLLYGVCVFVLKGVCLLHFLSENIFPVLRSN